MLVDPKFGKEVRAARRARDWSQATLALKLHPDRVPNPGIVYKIENGLVNITPELRKRLTRILRLEG
jgi:ribosome-binding protein aMBF1 (putative translation factor)